MDCGIATSKVVLLLLSLIFWAAGAVLAYVSAYMIRSFDSFDSFVQDKTTLIIAAIIIGVSVVMFLFGLLGCCATLRESKFGLGCFFMFIALIFAAEVAALVYGIIYHNKINGMLARPMTETFSKYNETSVSQSVDTLQKQFQCCGVNNYTSWANTTWFSQHKVVPLSCCKNTTSRCTGKMDQPELLNTAGCEGKLESLLQNTLTYALLVVLGFAVIKFFGMLSVFVITCKNGSRRSGYQQLYA